MTDMLEDKVEPRPISPWLAKRIAEAALSLAAKGDRYVVASYERDPATKQYFVEGFPTRADAEVYVLGHPELDLGIFGPYEPENGMVQKVPSVVSVIPKQVTRVLVTLDGGVAEPIDGLVYDAIFWGYPAIQKFVLPYYTASQGLEFANFLDAEYKQPGTYLLAHSDDTEYKIYKLVETPASEKLVNEWAYQLRPIR